LLLPTALHPYLEIPVLEVSVAAETIRMKMHYKPAWMPFAEDRRMSPENYTSLRR
jgi:hypothetical protein